MNFQKPENALRRAEELLGVGQPEHALQVLHQTIGNRRFRSKGWDIVQEQIMMQYVALCVDLQKLKVAREGLHQYRAVAQVANAQSLGKVLKELRDRAEAKLAQAKQKMENVKLEEISEDLEAEESPESLMLSMLAIDVRDEKGKEVHQALRMCWECYKMILDILRTTPKQEKVYHETAQRGLEFCLANTRPQEFKRLCEVIRNHYALLQKHRGKAEYEPLLRQEMHLETRLEQLKVSSKLQLWRESYQTAEDIHSLGIHEQLQAHKGSPAAVRAKIYGSIAMYYEKLAEIFWVSDLLLFHAQARMRYMLHTRHFNHAQSEASLGSMASIAVLAVLSIPLAAPEGKKVESLQQLEHHKKLSMLLNHPTVPTRESLKGVLSSRPILRAATPTVQSLYALMDNNEIDPLTICEKCRPLMDVIAQDPLLAPYIAPIKRIVFHKLITQLSKVYSSIGVPYFTSNICPESFLPWNEAEVVVVGLVRSGSLELRLDYAERAIYFGSRTVDPEAVIRQQLSTFGQQITDAVGIIDASHRADQQAARRAQFYSDIDAKMGVEEARLRKRNEAVKQRRDFQLEEQRRQEDAKRRQEKEKQEKEERFEAQRRIEEQKKREDMRRKEALQKEKKEAAEAIVEELKRLALSAAKVAAKTKDDDSKEVIVKGIPLPAIDVDKVASGFLTLEDYEKAHAEIRTREIQEKAGVRRSQAKRVDHLVRALLEEELEVLSEYECKQAAEDDEYLRSCREKQAEEHKVEKQSFMEYIPLKHSFVSRIMDERRENFEVKRAEQIERLTEQLKKEKVTRALTRMKEAHEKAKKENEERERRDREEREEAERNAKEEKARMDQEDRERKFKEQEEKQRQRDKEIEEKQQKASAAERMGSAARVVPATGSRFDALAEEGSWRGAAKKAADNAVGPTPGGSVGSDRRRDDDFSRGPSRAWGAAAGGGASSRADALRDGSPPPRRDGPSRGAGGADAGRRGPGLKAGAGDQDAGGQGAWRR